jgi:hypothetical protein
MDGEVWNSRVLGLLRFAKVELLRKPRQLSDFGRSDAPYEIRDSVVETQQLAQNRWWN